MVADTLQQKYDAEQIQVLEGLEPVRKRPGMYIGSTGSRGLHHLVYEVVDNSVDEALAGFCKNINVTICKDNAIQVEDDGRGMPVDEHPKLGIPAVEVIHTVLHAGGKFGEGGGYKVSGGLHGVGASVVNALSEHMEVEIKRDGLIYKQTYSKGETTSKLEVIGESKKTGSKTLFRADPEIFDEVEYDFSTLEHRLREMAFLNKGVRISLADEREGKKKKEVFLYEGGIKEFVKHQNQNKEPIHQDIIYFEADRPDEGHGEASLEIAMQYTKRFNETVFTYANNINTVDGGMHLAGFRASLTRVFNDYARRTGVLKEKDDSFTGDDVREGLTAIVSVKVSNPQFEGQTKGKLGNSDIRGFVESVSNERLMAFLEENPAQAKIILEKIIATYKVRIKTQKVREAERKSLMQGSSLPGKLADCSEKDPAFSEIFLVEGESAGGSAKMGRDRKTQAILPLRGKILNVEKAGTDKVLSSEEIKNMITAFGCGIDDQFDIEKLRYHKIIIMTDADVDGAHIRTLLLTFFFRHMMQLITEGHVYIAQPPLYRVKRAKEISYTYSEREQEKLLSRLAEEHPGAKLDIQRYKGLGEMDAEQLWETTMDISNRTLIQVTLDDLSAADAIFSMLMGDKVPPRRQFIEENAKYVKNLDI